MSERSHSDSNSTIARSRVNAFNYFPAELKMLEINGFNIFYNSGVIKLYSSTLKHACSRQTIKRKCSSDSLLQLIRLKFQKQNFQLETKL